MKSILQRLMQIEAKYRRDPLVVLAELDSGEQIRMSMRECLDRADAHFVKITKGSDLSDLDAFLRSLEKEATKTEDIKHE